jgi:hypothetical protein
MAEPLPENDLLQTVISMLEGAGFCDHLGKITDEGKIALNSEGRKLTYDNVMHFFEITSTLPNGINARDFMQLLFDTAHKILNCGWDVPAGTIEDPLLAGTIAVHFPTEEEILMYESQSAILGKKLGADLKAQIEKLHDNVHLWGAQTAEKKPKIDRDFSWCTGKEAIETARSVRAQQVVTTCLEACYTAFTEYNRKLLL